MIDINSKVLHILKYVAGAILSLIILGVVLGGLLFVFYVSSAPKLTAESLNATSSSLVFDSQDNLIADLGAEKRESVSSDNIPLNLVNAVTAIEDHRFFKHRGIDVYRIIGSAWRNLTSDSLQGGSTLDQQLIKLAYFSTASSDQTLKRKAQEAWLALQMEQQFTKEEILTFYVNKVFMGNGNYGMLTAAKSYYGKDLTELSNAQVALLAGIPQAPSQYNPYTNPEGAKARRDIVLSQMKRYGHITQEEYDEAVATPIDDGLKPLVETTSYNKKHDNYLTQVIEEMEAKGYDVFTAGLRIHTNLDQGIQDTLWDIYHTDSYVYYPDPDFQVASTIIDVQTGRVVAQLGGRNQTDEVSFGTNQAVLTDRDWGSTMKPITDYAPALEYGIYNSTGQQINDSVYYWPGTSTELNNWDRSHMGWMTMQSAIQQSRNVPAARSLEAVGLDSALEFLNGLGINYPEMLYSNSISSNTTVVDNQYGASSEKMAAAYAAFANGGTYYKPQYVHRIEHPDGRVENFEPEGQYAMSEQVAYMMTDMLKTVMVSPGTGTEAYIPGLFQAGKSGTSNYSDDEHILIANETGLHPSNVGIMAPDELFVGYTPQYSMAVWTGYRNRLTPIFGENLKIAKYVYRAMMSQLHSGGNSDWIMPAGLYRNGAYVVNGNSQATTPAAQQHQNTTQWQTQTSFPAPTTNQVISFETVVEETVPASTTVESSTPEASTENTRSEASSPDRVTETVVTDSNTPAASPPDANSSNQEE